MSEPDIMTILHQIAFWLGASVMVLGGISVVLLLGWRVAEYAMKVVSNGDAWFQVFCELSAQKKLRWQRKSK